MKIYKMGILGKKLGMTQVFTDDGKAVPVTVVQSGPCTVVQIKGDTSGDYSAIQLGFDDPREKSLSKSIKGHFAKAKTASFKILREIRLPSEETKGFSVGQVITADIFTENDFVDVSGVSKGKGFAGVIKRHHFHGFDAGHGTHECFRHGGSVGQHTFPGRIFRGMKMSGHMGNAQRTVQNLKVVRVIKDKNLLLIRGAVPGPTGAYLVVKKAIKKKPRPAAKKGGA
ncbi:MAG: 50S ribosomal protein L3 [Candidatus Aureabacteria bacterium]|nr:50S ribosomal protein L3 [Candidatus Auribacterota bacterium]